MLPNFKKFLLFFCILSFLSSCVPEPPPVREMSMLQIREIQTREYENVKYNEVIKAVIFSLQDEGFTITQASSELGLVTAIKDIEEVDKWTQFWVGAQGSYQTIRRLEANVTVKELGKKIKVRISLVAKGISNTGGVLWSRPIQDAESYQKLFFHIDKALFLEKEKI